jgi:NAD+ synthase (glutamine-hydrolysing)
MKDGFLRAAAATPEIRVADPAFNARAIEDVLTRAEADKVKLLVLPELCLTAYTCSDLFLQQNLLSAARKALRELIRFSEKLDMLFFVGLPWERGAKLYNVAAAIKGGRLLALYPKQNIPNYGEFYEARHFVPGPSAAADEPFFDGETTYPVPFGTDILLTCPDAPGLAVAAEICEDLWVANPPSVRHALAGATVIVNASASDETTGKDLYRRQLVSAQSARLLCAYLYADAGEGESSTDLVFAAHDLVCENGVPLAETKRFQNGMAAADIDLGRLVSERRRMTTFRTDPEGYRRVSFRLKPETLALRRFVDPAPFVPSDKQDRDRRCEEILSIQSMGLKKRLFHTRAKSAVVGVSGGLDSTLALLVTARAFDALQLPRAGILAVTMPCFGTTGRTYQNACQLARSLGCTLREVPIEEAVKLHFRDIGHDPEKRDITYENAQARERTQVLMDLANQSGGLVIGTGDMSELALGWATYNGDHMSMYAVNASVPKTLVRHLVRYYADTCGDEKLSAVLLDVLDTPVSPELLPPEDGKISQKTEDLVGPYELHDFFLYHILRFGCPPAKVYRLAKIAFAGKYENGVILKWLRSFYRRFFAQQFKRSCIPDGPKVGSVALSPRGDLRMPSDASAELWLREAEALPE